MSLGFGWGMVPELQVEARRVLTVFDPDGAVDVVLFWQQWRLDSAPLDRVADALIQAAHARLRIGT